MAINKDYQNAKKVAMVATALAFYGFMSLNLGLSLGPNPAITGHYSADIYTGRIKMNDLEKITYTHLFDKLKIDSKILEAKK